MHVNIRGMANRTRPEGCCVPRKVAPLASRVRTRVVGALKALADPTRLEIVRLVAAQEAPCCVCDIVDAFDLSQPTISHHLRVLREAGLLRVSKQGIWAFYEVDPGASELLDRVGALTSASDVGSRRAAAR
jgi:ArsR family transcriptional regulator